MTYVCYLMPIMYKSDHLFIVIVTCCLLFLLYVQISFAVYSKVVWWNKKYTVVTDYSYTSLLRKNKYQ